jgi:hypothetical protein
MCLILVKKYASIVIFQKNQECMNEMIGPATKHYPLSDKKPERNYPFIQ